MTYDEVKKNKPEDYEYVNPFVPLLFLFLETRHVTSC
jgi:hypothetical protein